MGDHRVVSKNGAAGGTGFSFGQMLSRHRDGIIRLWRDRLFTEVSDNYAARDPDELAVTTARAYDAFAQVLADNDYTGINLFIKEITEVRLEAGFPLDDVQKAFELFRQIIVPILVDESPRSVLCRNIQQVNTCLAYTIHRFSNHFQKMHETCLKEYADRLERDVAARTAQLKESEHKYKTLVEEISDGYLVLEGETIAFVNPAFCQMHGIDDPKQILITSFLNFVHKKERNSIRQADTRNRCDNTVSAAFEYRRLTRDGKALPTEMGFRPSRFEGRDYTLCIVRDITRRVKMEKKSRQMERMAYIGQITASLSHEIRNPLSSIKMNLQILGQNNPFTGNDQKRLQITQTEIQRLETILQQLLDFAKPISLTPEEVDINAVVDFCVTLLEVKFRKIQAECRVMLDTSLPRIMADRAKVEQVMINLLLNALDSVPAGGEVMVTTGIHTQDGSDFAVIQVADTGTGIPPDLIPHIFEPFYTTKTMGTGLGLANVKQIVQAHGGLVRVESREPFGTCFDVWLPFRGGPRG
ncbi:MAG TPA: ATP-binding protein [Desulfotignum sp.]|nr:ATP-binding protein [Desulfotignum sp.]